MFDLTGKTALITGATGGIGAGIAKALHGAGDALPGVRLHRLSAHCAGDDGAGAPRRPDTAGPRTAFRARGV